MAPNRPEKNPRRKSRYTADRGMPGAFEGETVTRRRFVSGGALAVGGIASAAFGLPALGFALGPLFEDGTKDPWQDVGPEADFNPETYVSKTINIQAGTGEAGKSTIYVRKFDEKTDKPSPSDTEQKIDPLPYLAISTRCAHLGCPVRYYRDPGRFVCPCHGGIYDIEGKVDGGPPVRPLDRHYTRVTSDGRVQVGERFSVNSELRRFLPRDPSNHLDGLWQYLYPGRPST